MLWRLFQTLVAITAGFALIYWGADIDGRAKGVLAIGAAFMATILVTVLAAVLGALLRRGRPPTAQPFSD